MRDAYNANIIICPTDSRISSFPFNTYSWARVVRFIAKNKLRDCEVVAQVCQFDITRYDV